MQQDLSKQAEIDIATGKLEDALIGLLSLLVEDNKKILTVEVKGSIDITKQGIRVLDCYISIKNSES